jgi:hypothetical protein
MRTGYMLLFQNAHQGMSDSEMVRHEMRLAELAEPLGFDTIWSAETTSRCSPTWRDVPAKSTLAPPR